MLILHAVVLLCFKRYHERIDPQHLCFIVAAIMILEELRTDRWAPLAESNYLNVNDVITFDNDSQPE